MSRTLQRRMSLTNTEAVVSSPYVFYRLHPDQELTDSSSNSGPDLVQQGAGTPFASGQDYRPDGSEDDVLQTAQATILDTIFDMSTLESEQIIIAFDLEVTGDSTGEETVFCFGERGGSVGFIAVGLNGIGQLTITMQGFGGSTDQKSVQGLPLYDLFPDHERIPLVISMEGIGSNEFNFHVCVQGVFKTTTETNRPVTVGGVPISPSNGTRQLVIGARKHSGGFERMLNETGASEARLQNLFICRLDAVDNNIPTELTMDWNWFKGELRGSFDGL